MSQCSTCKIVKERLTVLPQYKQIISVGDVCLPFVPFNPHSSEVGAEKTKVCF